MSGYIIERVHHHGRLVGVRLLDSEPTDTLGTFGPRGRAGGPGHIDSQPPCGRYQHAVPPTCITRRPGRRARRAAATSSTCTAMWLRPRRVRVVVGVDLREVLPLFRQLILGEDRVDWARLDARVAVDALLRVDEAGAHRRNRAHPRSGGCSQPGKPRRTRSPLTSMQGSAIT
jgi:hypothetical protein